nr:uncharacterized protein LOC104117736 [Nicotiana tomentosiformis]
MTAGDSSISTSIYSPNPSSPLFIHSSDIPGTCLVLVPFFGIGFGGWKRKMVVALSAKNKIAFIDGSFLKPSDNVVELKFWNICNNMVIFWLTSSLSPDIAESVQYSETVECIWKQVENRYGTVNRTKVFEIKKEFASTCQGPLGIASYFNKLKKLWDVVAFIHKNPINPCNCALQKELEEDKLHLPPKQQYTHKINFDQRVNVDQRTSIFCKYCKKHRHLVDKCYKLYGFSSNFKFSKGRRTAANVSIKPGLSDIDHYTTGAGSSHPGSSSSS